MPNLKTCTHIKVSGVRCGAAPLRGEQFCYFHQQAHRSVRRPPFSRLHPIAIIEDEDAIQASLMEVINGLVRNTLDTKRAGLILRALHIAVKNAGRVRLESHVDQKVREIPAYAVPTEEMLDPIPTESGSRVVLDEQAELPAVAAKEPQTIDPERPHWNEKFEDGGRVLARQTASKKAAAPAPTPPVRVETAVRPAAPKPSVPAASANMISPLDASRPRPNASVPAPGPRKPPITAGAKPTPPAIPPGRHRSQRATAG